MARVEGKSIEVKNLVKHYGEVEALRGISFSVEPGEIVGFLGPNGAGKSTTMKILTCFMGATSGEAKVAGFDVFEHPDEVRRRIGYLPESVPLYEDMIVWDYLAFVAELRGVPANKREAAIEKTVEMTGLWEMLGRTVSELSKGYRQRVGLAQAIIHEPDVVILDEPTSGLDPNQIVEIRDVIKTIGAEKTVLFSTHIMQEVAAVCDRIVIINRGKLTADDTLERLTRRMRDRFDGFQVSVTPGKKVDAPAIKKALSTPGVKVDEVSREDGALHLRISSPGDQDDLRRDIVASAAGGAFELLELSLFRPSLEQIFRTYTSGATEENLDAADTTPAREEEEE